MKKFVRAVEHRTFSGGYAVARGQPVLYVTERCVFELTKEGLALIEVAPGIDIEREILAQMEFRPIIRRDPAIMDRRIFAAAPMGLRDDLLRMPLEQRFTYHPRENGSSSSISKGTWSAASRTSSGSAASSSAMLAPLGHKVYAIVNYENFQIFPDIMDEYSEMVRDLSDRFYLGVTRYTTNGFLRTKLGDALSRRAVAPHIYESAEEARAHLRELEGRAAG